MTFRFLGKTCGFMGYFVQYACFTHCTFEYIGDFVMCSGPSMEPTLESNNILLTEHISPRLQRLRRGDIIIAKSPSNPKQNICKRITGLAGDKVRGHFPSRSHVVPRGHVWLEGDNSSNSADSRIYGPVPEGLIRSRVICRVWPFDKITSLTEY
ncbi:putative IMP1 inner mitochondrial membrane peptidase-like protein [Operophtera brumata]|uniref:Mitochondrial inner membrane protease subunit n=1 Tax=Operophtera brumata TaxID=104452 RepID=A0A0L7L5G2_OPEBR|nr:putative IMP1 inner mitochondrial membrane peptidase-like protein [Operophtera brumata]KOB70571.1 putative IMP1 inner mitochondrial membrane peptidase-like protein [Operophtera brumata]